MEEIGSKWTLYFIPGTDISIPWGGINIFTVSVSVTVMGFILFISYIFSYQIRMIPTKTQALLEIILIWFSKLVQPILKGAKSEVLDEILPFVLSLFSFILLAILFSLIPLPYIEEPTGDINCTLALAILSLIYSWIIAVRYKGVNGLLKEFQGPLYSHTTNGKTPNIFEKASVLFFFPFKLLEEFSKVISLSCRLFGNTLGSGIVSTIISTLTFYLFIPILIDVLLTGFESFIQAFVFASLTTVYISSYLSETESLHNH